MVFWYLAFDTDIRLSRSAKKVLKDEDTAFSDGLPIALGIETCGVLVQIGQQLPEIFRPTLQATVDHHVQLATTSPQSHDFKGAWVVQSFLWNW
ncbi:hypothetical protein ASE39_03625 [Acidovorax sp. Root267]|nr:hypothetical protein ASE39_03625 [Acidovorax sp. Root267]